MTSQLSPQLRLEIAMNFDTALFVSTTPLRAVDNERRLIFKIIAVGCVLTLFAALTSF